MDKLTSTAREHDRLTTLTQAGDKALALLDAIEAAGLIAPGRTECEVEQDIYAMAERDFGVKCRWHKRIVRAGINTVAIYSQDPPVLTIGSDDIVFLDIGPVFAEWEADVGRSYPIGDNPIKQALCRDLPVLFEAVKSRFDAGLEKGDESRNSKRLPSPLNFPCSARFAKLFRAFPFILPTSDQRATWHSDGTLKNRKFPDETHQGAKCANCAKPFCIWARPSHRRLPSPGTPGEGPGVRDFQFMQHLQPLQPRTKN